MNCSSELTSRRIIELFGVPPCSTAFRRSISGNQIHAPENPPCSNTNLAICFSFVLASPSRFAGVTVTSRTKPRLLRITVRDLLFALKFCWWSVRRFQQRDNLSLRDRLINHRPFLNLV